jgi:hypothetical protein
MHAKTFFKKVLFVVWKYNMIVFFFNFERLGRMHENKNIFLFNFSMFWWKLCILIPDLYLYGMKIQTNIKQNSVEKYAGKSQIFSKIFFKYFFDWARPGPLILSYEQWRVN